MALAVISRAEEDGRLRPGDTVVEYTGGSTGAALALVCAARGYRLRIVTSDAFSREKRNHMAALGAELTIVAIEEERIDYQQVHVRRATLEDVFLQLTGRSLRD